MKSMMKDTAIMFAITLIAGLILGAVYQITKDPIARQEELAMQEASRQVFASAASFETAADFDEGRAQTVLNEGGYPEQTIDGYQVALDEAGAAVGFVITVTSHEGYGGDIQFLMGVNSDGSLNGISLLSISAWGCRPKMCWYRSFRTERPLFTPSSPPKRERLLRTRSTPFRARPSRPMQ